MCVVVEASESDPHWCHEDAAIRVPASLTRAQMLSLARMILAGLGAEQPAESTMEARCYCGTPVTIWDMPRAARVPGQRVRSVTEVHRGA